MDELNKQNVFDFITSEESAFQTLPITVSEGYEWNFYEHINLSSLYKASKYSRGNSDEKPFKNIMRPILNLQYRAEGFDVKDIVLFVNDRVNYWKSFLIKKFHEKWARENGVDTFIDDKVESYVDFGGALIKDVNDKKPEVVPLQRIAFCDQTDILSGPICEKHFYSPDQLKEMEGQGWGNKNKGATITIDELITLSKSYKTSDLTKKQSKTPGKYIKAYELHGMFPDWWLDREESETKDNEFTRQLHIVAFYQKEGNQKQGVHLYKGKEKKLIYKFIARDKIYGRALGFGGAEELFEPQVWTNYSAIRIKEILDAASKVLYQTADKAFAQRNKIKNLDNQEILTYEEGKPLSQINTTPVNIRLFENSIIEWEDNARKIGAANESIMGESPTAGTPFKLQELITAESHSLHEYRKGKLATFLEEIYRDWIIPHISKEINQGQEFLANLDLDEMQGIADAIVINEANKLIKEKILNGESVEKEEIETYKQKVRDSFMKGGNKKFIQILKDELKDAPLDVSINIVGKQKNLSAMTDKLVNVFRQMLSTYNAQTGTFAIFDDPRMAKIFNEIIEYSGLSPIDFYQRPKAIQQLAPQLMPQGQPAPKLQTNLAPAI